MIEPGCSGPAVAAQCAPPSRRTTLAAPHRSICGLLLCASFLVTPTPVVSLQSRVPVTPSHPAPTHSRPAASSRTVPPVLPHEVVVFATGYDGPIDNGDDWRYFHFGTSTHVVSMGGGVPSNLVTTAHARGVRVTRGAVLDVDTVNITAVKGWVESEVAKVTTSGADGVTVVRITQPPGTPAAAVTAAVALLRSQLVGLHLSIVLPLNLTQSEIDGQQQSKTQSREQPKRAGRKSIDQNFGNSGAVFTIDRPALAEQVDFIVLAATLDPDREASCTAGSPHLPHTPEPNVRLGTLASAASTSGIPVSKTVVTLPWFGWDYRMGECPGVTCGTVLPPPHTRACWRGWNLQRSVAYIQGTLVGLYGAVGRVVPETGTAELRYNDSTGVNHVVSYDTPDTLKAKYAACKGFRGVGVWTADMVSYVGDPASQQLAAAMWKSIDAAAPPSAHPQHAQTADAPSALRTSPQREEKGAAKQRLVNRLAARFRKRQGLGAGSLIPGYNPCRHATPIKSGCADGLVCISPSPNSGPAEHESGGCYPVHPGRSSFVARTRVPPIPPTFRPEQATVYYYLNLVMPDDGNSDVTNSTKGYGFMNQFVPQLELGEALCGSTGREGGYQTGPCAIVDPLKQWVIQSQYFFGVLNHSGIPDPSGVSWTGDAVTGETVPVFPGEVVVTNFTMLTNGTWLLSLSVDPADAVAIPGRGNTVSVVQVDHPYMNPKLNWLNADYNHTLVGACNEVYNLEPRPGDVARPLEMNITVSDSGRSNPDPSWSEWRVNEGLPQCASGFRAVNLTTSVAGGSQTACLWAV